MTARQDPCPPSWQDLGIVVAFGARVAYGGALLIVTSGDPNPNSPGNVALETFVFGTVMIIAAVLAFYWTERYPDD